jgi:hypothetical protein
MTVTPQPVIDEIIAYSRAGMPRSAIADKVGMSRSSICGLLWRRGERPVERERKPPSRPVRKLVVRSKPPKSTPVTLLEISKRGCHWPVSGEGLATMFCNASRRNSGHVSYCKFHAMKSINPGKSRRDRGGALI